MRLVVALLGMLAVAVAFGGCDERNVDLPDGWWLQDASSAPDAAVPPDADFIPPDADFIPPDADLIPPDASKQLDAHLGTDV